ncbi:bifunctional 3-(3-hydroxy-phenyl)propionate/3-hydroxycinnamic acid hydroxylase MhpA [Actinomadura montaniterrae]|uniref:Bifunctional 3-(3-hydroxy-phenyl)propionate/3-hydroxycinnamic acid hydroxylase n=1 Tax=Actinomadura montaniterrae TaxID=1803903 RepID=A0A6L3W5J2_9ACTN|nr:bifunctional 3-(3-hydroxy-phenyl)propionate/3-hydroxycinnamic acid hydroxylase [Actinomadura montaniterrae]KAB2384850.1 bifunctional 3-(3-hydroxy-phenyl)propionate/3-hydroxycinnamic acid hydroxylase [Actinomadura montaniterrae]
MSESPHYDVAVIGYGPTGVTAANLLGALGVSVVIIERKASVYSRARAISTDEEVMRVWQQAGLAERLKQDMLPDRPIDFVDAAGRSFISAVPTPREQGHPPQMFIYQPAMEDVLREGVQRYPNVEVLLEHECLRVRQDDQGVELLVAQLGRDRLTRVRASYVIAADGGSSPTRGQLGVGFEGRTYEDRWLVIDTKLLNEWPGYDRLRFHCDPDRPAVDCPTPLGHHRWEFPVLPGEDGQELVTEAAIWRLLGRQGITGENVSILRAVIYSHHVRFADRWRIGRIFLAGDAAHVMPPWIGQGMAAGVRDAANLCWKLAAVLSGALPDSVLDSYQAERAPHVRNMTRRAVLVGRIITERRPWITALRDPAFRGLGRLGRLNRALQAASWIPACRYRDGFFRTIEGTAAPGRKVPQPWVLDESNARVRLDDVLGAGWSLLHLGSSPDETWQAAADTVLQVLPAGAAPRPGAVVDTDGTLTDWMREMRAVALVLRPDRIVYTAATATSPLTSPPPFLNRQTTSREKAA